MRTWLDHFWGHFDFYTWLQVSPGRCLVEGFVFFSFFCIFVLHSFVFSPEYMSPHVHRCLVEGREMSNHSLGELATFRPPDQKHDQSMFCNKRSNFLLLFTIISAFSAFHGKLETKSITSGSPIRRFSSSISLEKILFRNCSSESIFWKQFFANHFEYCLVHFNIILHILLRRIRCSHFIHNTIYKNVNHDTEMVFLRGFRHANTNKTQNIWIWKVSLT